MTRIEGEIVINRPVDEVFDFVADERNELRYNSRMVRAELITPEPIGPGAVFRVETLMLRRVVETTVEFTVFERPRLLGLRSYSVTRGRGARSMLTEGSLSFVPLHEGTRLQWSWVVESPGAFGLAAPLAALVGSRQEKKIWGNLKRLLEREPRPA